MRNPERPLELGLIYRFRLNKGKGVLSFWVVEASFGKAIQEKCVQSQSLPLCLTL